MFFCVTGRSNAVAFMSALSLLGCGYLCSGRVVFGHPIVFAFYFVTRCQGCVFHLTSDGIFTLETDRVCSGYLKKTVSSLHVFLVKQTKELLGSVLPETLQEVSPEDWLPFYLMDSHCCPNRVK